MTLSASPFLTANDHECDCSDEQAHRAERQRQQSVEDRQPQGDGESRPLSCFALLHGAASFPQSSLHESRGHRQCLK